MATMTSQHNIYPLFFTLEHVNNGYILTARQVTGGVSDAGYCKEVVSEDKINARIGQLLHVEALSKEIPVVFHVEAIGEGTYQHDPEDPADGLMEAKLAYFHFSSRCVQEGAVLLLHFTDSKMIEVYGTEAERVAKANNLPLLRPSGIPLLQFPDTKEGKVSITSLFDKPTLVEVTSQKITDWYRTHLVQMEKKNSKTSNT
jgi:hypothetical protein